MTRGTSIDANEAEDLKCLKSEVLDPLKFKNLLLRCQIKCPCGKFSKTFILTNYTIKGPRISFEHCNEWLGA